jgi:alpha-L-fucosidase
VGFNHGEPAGEIRIGEMGGPGPLDDPQAAGPYQALGRKGYLLGEFALPILNLGGRWFYTNPKNDRHAMSPWALLGLYLGAVKYGNIFSLDVGPGRTGRLRAIDERTLIETGKLIREWAPKTRR